MEVLQVHILIIWEGFKVIFVILKVQKYFDNFGDFRGIFIILEVSMEFCSCGCFQEVFYHIRDFEGFNRYFASIEGILVILKI